MTCRQCIYHDCENCWKSLDFPGHGCCCGALSPRDEDEEQAA